MPKDCERDALVLKLSAHPVDDGIGILDETVSVAFLQSELTELPGHDAMQTRNEIRQNNKLSEELTLYKVAMREKVSW